VRLFSILKFFAATIKLQSVDCTVATTNQQPKPTVESKTVVSAKSYGS
jgi:hypothetical protein